MIFLLKDVAMLILEEFLGEGTILSQQGLYAVFGGFKSEKNKLII